MKSQSWPIATLPENNAGPIERAENHVLERRRGLVRSALSAPAGLDPLRSIFTYFGHFCLAFRCPKAGR